MKKPIRIAAFAAAALVMCAGASAQGLAATDADFLRKAAEGGHAEIEAGKVAQAQGSHDEVKSFGAQMVADHAQAAEELQRIATAKGVILPAGPGKPQAASVQQLKARQGAEFDKGYAATFGVQAHEQMLELMKRGAQSKDADVKAYAEKMLPAVEHHLEMGRQLRSSIGKVYRPAYSTGTMPSGARP